MKNWILLLGLAVIVAVTELIIAFKSTDLYRKHEARKQRKQLRAWDEFMMGL